MEIIIRQDAAAAVEFAAGLLTTALRDNPRLVLGLATGRTMEGVYALLAETHRRDGLDFSLCRTFNLDEYVGLAPDDPNSYRAYMQRHLFDRVNIDARNTHLPDGMAADLQAAGAQYEKAIRRAGGIDLQLLGIGQNGHIGFNEPSSSLCSRTRPKTLTPETVAQNGPLFDHPDRMPRRALTMGIATIMASRRCILLATGAGKAAITAQALEGPVTAMIPATALQLHPHCTVILDEAAAARLQGCAYYRWTFEHEPKWSDYR